MKSVMDLKEAARLLEIVPVAEKQAMSCKEIAERFFGKSGSDTAGGIPLTQSEIRKIQRYLQNLSQPKNNEPAVIKLTAEKSRGGRAYNRKTFRYWQEPTALNKLLMTEKNALDLILAQQILQRSFAGELAKRSKVAISDAMAESVVNMDVETRRLRARLRVVPDWFGRVPAEIKPEILSEVINAIAKDRQLRFEYKSPSGDLSQHTVSPCGLVAKDWSIYLLFTKGLIHAPGRALPLHRFNSASCTAKPRDSRTEEFDLDGYIKNTHQLAHALDSQPKSLQLELKVAPGTIYHFKERKLSLDQDIDGPDPESGHYMVKATVVKTVLLIPFLLSMLEGIEVVGPKEIRLSIAEKLLKMNSYYENSND